VTVFATIGEQTWGRKVDLEKFWSGAKILVRWQARFDRGVIAQGFLSVVGRGAAMTDRRRFEEEGILFWFLGYADGCY
jgi:hypothetical protein